MKHDGCKSIVEKSIEMEGILEDMLKDMFSKIAGIELNRCEKSCGDVNSMNSVYSNLRGTPPLNFAICVDTNVMKHIAEHMLGEKVEDQDEIVECFEEFGNIVSGRLLGYIYEKTGESIWFKPPSYCKGCYIEKYTKVGMVTRHYKDPNVGLISLLYDKRLDLIIYEKAEGLK